MRWVVMSGLLVSCGGEEVPRTDEERVEDVLKLEGDGAAGERVFADQCAQCHGTDGSGADGDVDLGGVDLRGSAADTVVSAVVIPGPGMLSFATLPDQDVADVAAYASAL